MVWTCVIIQKQKMVKAILKFVLIVMWVHLFPSRTQKLSTCTLTILGG